MFDEDAGLYVFEVVLGIRLNGSKGSSAPFLIQADDAEEAEEKVLEYFDDLDIDQKVWIEEMSEPFALEEYQQQIEEKNGKFFPVLDEMSEDELCDYIGY